jgi:GTP cyclohydrolase II
MNLDPHLLAAERAIDEVRCGRPLLVDDAGTTLVHAAVETLRPAILEALRPLLRSPWTLLVTPQRLQAMASGIPASTTGTTGAVRLALPEVRTLARAVELATGEGAAPAACSAGDRTDSAVIDLLKAAWLLPAALRAEVSLPISRAEGSPPAAELLAPGILHRVNAAALAALPAGIEMRVETVSEANIPLLDAASARFVCFRTGLGSREHLAVIIGAPDPAPGVPVRLHSACLTGDVFGSLRCDCGDQLRQSVASLQALGGGVLLYLSQEGRGIGLANKLRAYSLQDMGRDTIDADLQLGFSPDERRYGVAAAMLRALGFARIRLMTNNPDKIEALTGAGITIVERVPLLAHITPQNRRYMDAKRTRARHLLDPASG